MELSRVKMFEGIDSRDPLADAPLNDPLPPGRAVYLRFGAVVTLGLGLASAGSVIASELHPTPTMEVGGCVKGSFRVEPEPCDSSDVSGRIIAFKSRAEGCPDRADSYVETTGGVWCIDDR